MDGRDITLHWTLASQSESMPGGVGISTAYLDNYTDAEHAAVEAVFRLSGLMAAKELRDAQRQARLERGAVYAMQRRRRW